MQEAIQAERPTRIEKPWGHELIWAHTSQYVGKLLCIKAGHLLSLQYHEEKDETIFVSEGLVEMQVGKDTVVCHPGISFHIEPRTLHRMRAIEDTILIEVSTPQLDDVVRVEDSYGRVDTRTKIG